MWGTMKGAHFWSPHAPLNSSSESKNDVGSSVESDFFGNIYFLGNAVFVHLYEEIVCLH